MPMNELNIEDEITRAKRGITWIRLEEALRGAGCPVCTEIERTEEHYFEDLLYEYVLDAGVRKKLHRQHGFCTRHAGLALAAERKLKSDGLHLATMLETVAEEHFNQMQNQMEQVARSKQASRNRKRRTSVGAVAAEKCFVCDFLEESENIALHGLMYFSDDDEFIELYRKSKTLICYRHIQMVVKEAADPAWTGKTSERVLRVTLEKLGKLKRDLSNFVRKHDYKTGHDYTTDERNSYIDIVNFFSGRMR